MTWAVASLVTVQGLVCGLALMPVLALWYFLLDVAGSNAVARVFMFSLALMPSYALFALCLMIVSPLALRLLGWRTPPDAAMPLVDVAGRCSVGGAMSLPSTWSESLPARYFERRRCGRCTCDWAVRGWGNAFTSTASASAITTCSSAAMMS